MLKLECARLEQLRTLSVFLGARVHEQLIPHVLPRFDTVLESRPIAQSVAIGILAKL